MIKGTVTIIVADAISPHGRSYCPWNIEMPTGTVRINSFVLNVNANRNSFQAVMNIMIAVVNIPGSASGKMTLKYVWKIDAPSIFADSSSSNGIVLKKADKFQMASGKAKVV